MEIYLLDQSSSLNSTILLDSTSFILIPEQTTYYIITYIHGVIVIP